MAARRITGFLAITASAAVAPVRAQNQQPGFTYLEAGLAAARTRSAAGTLVEPRHGAVLALAGGIMRSGLLLEARYVQGSLASDDPTLEERDLVEGELQFGVRLLPSISVLAGPHVRAYSSPSGTRRWVFWEARVAGTAPIIPSRLDAYTQLWGAVAGSTSLARGFGSERGGEVGARLTFPRTPLGLRIAYRIDRGSGINPVQSDALEQIVIAARVGSR